MSRKAVLSRIYSFSSEDPNHPASNLLMPDTFRKWKCKNAGEKEAFVIIQLEKVEKIMSIDVGNEFSAFIEVFVARSGGETQEFQVIQSQTAFMTVSESKAETNGYRVKMFCSSLTKPVTAEKWNLIKVVCKQPFNTRIQYGISFINIILEPDPTDKLKIGNFEVRKCQFVDEDDETDDPIRIGSFFSKRRELEGINKNSVETSSLKSSSSSPTVSLAGLIRGMSSTLAGSVFSGTSNAKKVNGTSQTTKLDPITSSSTQDDTHISTETPALVTKSKNQIPSSDSPSPKGFPDNSETSVIVKAAVVKKSNSKDTSESQIFSSPKTSTTSLPGSSSGKKLVLSSPGYSKGKPSLKRKKKTQKPFKKLFDGVVFVMSGFENPYRSELRRKAVEMGAQCKQDWNSSCTHLICAFVNTPKFRQVKGSGNAKIVKKNWIEDSHKKKCRFPWRRYCLDKHDEGDESEDEIFVEGESSESEDSEFDNHESGVIVGKSHGILRTDVTDEEDDDILISSSVNSKSPGGNSQYTKRRRIARISSSSSDDPAYDADTDVDETPCLTNDSSIFTESNHQKYNDFFNSKSFSLHPSQSLHQDQRIQIEQIIQRHKGNLNPDLSGVVDYIVTEENEWNELFSLILAKNPNLVVIDVNWIEKCEEENNLVCMESYIISPKCGNDNTTQ